MHSLRLQTLSRDRRALPACLLGGGPDTLASVAQIGAKPPGEPRSGLDLGGRFRRSRRRRPPRRPRPLEGPRRPVPSPTEPDPTSRGGDVDHPATDCGNERVVGTGLARSTSARPRIPRGQPHVGSNPTPSIKPDNNLGPRWDFSDAGPERGMGGAPGGGGAELGKLAHGVQQTPVRTRRRSPGRAGRPGRALRSPDASPRTDVKTRPLRASPA